MTAALTPHRGVLRILRGLTLATVNAALAVAAHVVGDGSAPDGALTLLLTLAVAAAGMTLADRRRGPAAMLGAVAITQLVLHLLLDGLGRHHSTTGAATAAAPSGLAMTAAHAAAVVVTAALLAGAESALFTVADLLCRVIGRLPPQPTPLPATPLPAQRPTSAPLPTAVLRLLRRVMPRRGPPLPAQTRFTQLNPVPEPDT